MTKSERDFAQFLVDQTPVFDEMILQDIRPTDGWLFNVSGGTSPCPAEWWERREDVRMIVEGPAYHRSRMVREQIEPMDDRFQSVFPKFV